MRMFFIHQGHQYSVILYLLIALWITISGCHSQVVTGTVGEDVLLPCIVHYQETFHMAELTVNWQTENDTVVHSFHSGYDQPDYQASEFHGRTQMFLQEFNKGNLSLLIMRLHKSDAGKYVCYVALNNIQAKWTELVIQDREQSFRTYYLTAIGAAFLPVLAFISICYKRKKMKKKIDEDELEVLLIAAPGFEFIESYRKRIKELFKTSSDLLSSYMPRTLLIPEWRTQHLEPRHTLFNTRTQKDSDAISSEKLFTKESMKLSSKRMLLAGEAGIGKSHFVEGLQKQWASGQQKIVYDCVIYFTFTELNMIKTPMSVNELLISKCKELEPALPNLLESGKLLIIFDGMDEFKLTNVKSSQDSIDNDTPLNMEELILNILSKVLLPNTNVLVTSRVTSVNLAVTKEYFERTFIIKEFSDDEIKEFCKKSCSGDDISQNICHFIEEHNLSSLASIPLLSNALCELSKNYDLSNYADKLSTRSGMMVSLLKVCLKNISSSVKGEPCCETNEIVLERVTEMVRNITCLSYDNLVAGEEDIRFEELCVTCVHTQQLLQEFCVFFFKKSSTGDKLQYRHTSIRDMFAALHCVWEIHNSGGAKEFEDCLDFWVSGKLPSHQNTISLLQNIPSKHKVEFHNFTSFVMGFMTYKDISSLNKPKRELNAYEVLILNTYFSTWLKNGPKEAELLRLFHCVYEVHNDSVKEHVSKQFTTMDLFDTPLNALDIRAIRYCLEKLDKLDKLNLSLCDLRDENLQCLEIIIRKSSEVILTSNMLTSKSGIVIKNILEHPQCAIKELFLAINHLGPAGVQHIWSALKMNTSVEKLNLCDNDIQDVGTENMVSSLEMNQSLKKLILCMNVFTEHGKENIDKLIKHQKNLKVVMKTTEDEEFFSFVQDILDNLKLNEGKRYHKAWVHHILTLLQNDLRDEDNHSEKVTQLKKDISDILNMNRRKKRGSPQITKTNSNPQR
ncbi:protein NLRC5-like [Hyperolius riggenbachi]|uniref:protein NLRC5-like n=1 Tax=Hyperolius riggenbachi TaxID=752182 RepID=UPI0035A270CB